MLLLARLKSCPADGHPHHFSAFNGKVMPGVMYADLYHRGQGGYSGYGLCQARVPGRKAPPRQHHRLRRYSERRNLALRNGIPTRHQPKSRKLRLETQGGLILRGITHKRDGIPVFRPPRHAQPAADLLSHELVKQATVSISIHSYDNNEVRSAGLGNLQVAASRKCRWAL
jgi:hypothetical protein